MTQTEHLKLIRDRCVELLEIAEKRTAGVWRTFPSYRVNELSGLCVAEMESMTSNERDCNAAFIASCAGAAEAGWLATIAAVDAFFKLDGVTYGWDGDCGAACIADALADSIISAWPIELLNNKWNTK